MQPKPPTDKQRLAQSRREQLLRNRRPHNYRTGRLKVDHLLTPEHRVEYEALLRDQRNSGAEAEKWLVDHGYDIGSTAVYRHLRQFRGRLNAVRDAAEMSLACADLTRQTDQPVLADGAVCRFETLLTQALFKIERGENLDREQWDMLGKALTHAVGNRTKLEELRRTFEDAKRHAARAAEDAAKDGADASTVVERVKEILGV